MSPAIRKVTGNFTGPGELRELSSTEGQAKFALQPSGSQAKGARPFAPEEITLTLTPAELTLALTPFDQPHYRRLIAARSETIRNVVEKLKPALRLATAVDAGCGLGFFAQTLAEAGLAVCGFDGRGENIAEARRRFPQIPFEIGDVESAEIAGLGQFDLVLSFGLLYHLENPLLAVRNLRALTGKCLFLESMCVPGEKSELLLREEPRVEDQSLTDLACYPSENSLVKMLYRSGFTAVYRVAPLPEHDDFQETAEHARRRTVLVASIAPIDVAGFRLMPEPREERDPWNKKAASAKWMSVRKRVWRFAKSPAKAKYITLAMRLRRRFPDLAIPLRLKFGAWWLAEKSALDDKLMHGEFEAGELRFVERFLEPGMTVVDVGAHHGLYTLLAAKCVGREGSVLAFEPSERECARLQKHLRVNRCRNVRVMKYALGSEPGNAEFYVVDGPHDFCNSLRLPDVPDAVRQTKVEVRRLDQALEETGKLRVDFVKLDVEGGELEVLAGAERLLERRPRPVLLVEVEDRRTRGWGYRAKEIIERVAKKGFRWHWIDSDGGLEPLNVGAEEYEGNFVAVPAEREGEMRSVCRKGRAE